MFFSRPRPANLLNGLLASRIDATGPSGCFSRRSFPAGAAALGPSTSCLRMWASGVCSNGRAVYRKKCAFPWFWSTTLSPHGRPCLHLAPQRPTLPFNVPPCPPPQQHCIPATSVPRIVFGTQGRPVHPSRPIAPAQCRPLDRAGRDVSPHLRLSAAPALCTTRHRPSAEKNTTHRFSKGLHAPHAVISNSTALRAEL